MKFRWWWIGLQKEWSPYLSINFFILQVASLFFAQYTNWQTMSEVIHRRNLWDVQHVVGSLQLKRSSLTTVNVRFPWKVSCQPADKKYTHKCHRKWTWGLSFSIVEQMCVCLLSLNLHDLFYNLHKKQWNIVQRLVAWIVAVQEYQCSHCSKYYPSERLLRDHMRHHVNHYKCTFCDMTCPTPSSLSVHIRYRHLTSKPFKCRFCEYTWVCVFTLHWETEQAGSYNVFYLYVGCPLFRY